MKQVLALAVACLLVAGALLTRDALEDDGEGDDPAADDDGDLVVACIPELEEACRAIDRNAVVRIEDPEETIAAVAEGERVDAWVTLDPWPEIAAFHLPDERFLAGDQQGVASAPLVLITRTEQIEGGCGDEPNWVCVVAAAPGRVAIPAPTTALGRVVLGWAAVEWAAISRPGQPFALAELDLPEFQAWIEDIDFGDDDPLQEALQFGVSGPLAIGVSEPDADRIRGTREEDQLHATRGQLAASSAVVVVGPESGRVAGEPGFSDGLRRLGWSIDPGATSEGLPSAGLLIALAEMIQ